MRLTVIGTGYVGLVSGAGFSDFGNDVTCVDLDADRIARLRQGEVPIHEPGLAEIVVRNAAAGRLHFTTDLAKAVATAEIVILAVGTPQGADGSADLTYIDAAAAAVAKALQGPTVLVTKSTVPVGTGERIAKIVAANTTHKISVASNPEFLKEGDAINDFMRPSRVIIGANDEQARAKLVALYTPFIRLSDRIMVMDVRSAELTKYAANAMLATRISFMNELARLADAVGADIDFVRKGIGSDSRIGPKFLFPGPGFGGSCFPKDIRALAHIGREVGIPMEVVEATERANAQQKQLLGKQVVAHFGDDLRGRRIAIWGLSFKPETDDIREAPAHDLILALHKLGAEVIGYDPVAMDNVKASWGDVLTLAPTMYDAVAGADALCIVTEWKQFRSADLERVGSAMRQKAVFDGRNIWDPASLQNQGFVYFGIGRNALTRRGNTPATT